MSSDKHHMLMKPCPLAMKELRAVQRVNTENQYLGSSSISTNTLFFFFSEVTIMHLGS